MKRSETLQDTIRRPPAEEEAEAVRQAVRSFQDGTDREGSFRTLVEVYDPVVKAFFARRLRATEECLDLTQETFLRVYKGLKGYRGDAPFGAWLFRIAWNVLRRRVADPRPGRTVALDPPKLEVLEERAREKGAEEAPAFASALRQERRAILWGAIARLPPQRRRCLTLWARYELSYEQIAVVMRLSLGTVKAHLAQARAQLDDLVTAETTAQETTAQETTAQETRTRHE